MSYTPRDPEGSLKDIIKNRSNPDEMAAILAEIMYAEVNGINVFNINRLPEQKIKENVCELRAMMVLLQPLLPLLEKIDANFEPYKSRHEYLKNKLDTIE